MADLYFDPQSGDLIDADEFSRRYTYAAFMLVKRAPRPVAETPAEPGLRRYGSSCRVCGTATIDGAALCADCAAKPQHAPRTMFALESQGVAPYAAPAPTTKVAATPDEVPAGTVLGGGAGSHDGH